QKEALVRVKARVSIGYDLEGMSLKADQESRTITLFAPDDPQILSVEHDVDYYDLKEGLFNSFSPRELTRLTGKAKQQVIEKVPMTGLFHEAHRQRDDMIGMMRGIAETAGWKLELGDRHNALALDRKL